MNFGVRLCLKAYGALDGAMAKPYAPLGAASDDTPRFFCPSDRDNF